MRLLNLFTALDQLLWVVLTLGVGKPDETISAALWRMELEGKRAGKWFRPVVDFFARPFEKDHCFQAWQAEMKRSQLPEEYR